jgi:hypothetical protein
VPLLRRLFCKNDLLRQRLNEAAAQIGGTKVCTARSEVDRLYLVVIQEGSMTGNVVPFGK